MRWLFYLLVVVNLLLFVWINQQPSQEAGGGKHDVGDIRIIDEAEVATIPEGDTSTPPKQRFCSSLGVFVDRDTATQLGKALAATNIASSIQASLQTVVVDYRVIIPAVDDQKSADWIMQKLLDSGFESPWKITGGELDGSISLGVFENRDNALAQRIRAERLGLEAKVIERNEEREIFRVNLSDQLANLATDEIVNSLQKSFGPFEIKEKRCLEIVQSQRKE